MSLVVATEPTSLVAVEDQCLRRWAITEQAYGDFLVANTQAGAA